MQKFLRQFLLIAVITLMAACSSSDVKDAIDVAEGVPRKDIDRSYLGVNAFANDSLFGSPESQFIEVRDTLRLKQVRVLVAWNDAQHPDPNSPPFWGFYDDLLGALPSGVSALIVVTGIPSWMNNSANWIEGNPRRTFVERWLRPVLRRYGRNDRISAVQVWNEPNMLANPDNTTLGVATAPTAFVELLALARNVVDEVVPRLLMVSGATTAINQDFPTTLDYNRAMRDAGAGAFVDRWGMHVYGKQYERFIRSGGVTDFINELGEQVWVTESGAQGVNEQLAYGEEMWPYLREEMPNIERIYIYQFTENTPSATTYGLLNPTAGSSLSDLFVWLRDTP